MDRAWRIWQAAHPGANPPANILNEALQTDPAMHVHQTLDVHLLEITEPLAALPGDTSEFTVAVLAFDKSSDTEGVLRFKELTLLTYA